VIGGSPVGSAMAGIGRTLGVSMLAASGGLRSTAGVLQAASISSNPRLAQRKDPPGGNPAGGATRGVGGGGRMRRVALSCGWCRR